MIKTRLHLLSLPPSVNAIWRFTKEGKMYRTSEYNRWRMGEGINLKAQLRSQRKFIGPVFLTLAMRRPSANSDIDNRSKACLDLLQHVGAIDNDKHVMGLNMFWTVDLPAGVAAEVSIVEADELKEVA